VCDEKENFSVKFLVAVGLLDGAVVDFTSSKGSCEMRMAVVAALDQREDRRGYKPEELSTRLSVGANHLQK
jgi:hypothetical protein